MILISKKRIQLILTLIIISTFTFLLANQGTNKLKTNETTPTVALPVTNKVIVVDAGHGVPDEGAQSSSRNNRSRNQPKNSAKTTKPTRTIRSNCNFNKV